MPHYKQHLFAGFCFFSGVMCIMLILMHPTLLQILEWLSFALIGSLFPDIDIKSKGQKIFYRVLLVVFCILLFQGHYETLVLLSFIAFIPLLVSHRTFFHNMWFILLIAGGIWAYCYYAFPCYSQLMFYDLIFFCAGCLSHIWLDLGLKRGFKLKLK